MEVLTRLSIVPKISVCLLGLVSAFYAVINLTYFLSSPTHIAAAKLSQKNVSTRTSHALLVDMILITLFVLQHSFMASQKVKDIFNSHGLQSVFRSLYVLATSGVLTLLIRNWEVTSEVTLWSLNLNYRPLWWIYLSIHSMAWLIIYVGNICTDVTELLGIKQVYYSLANLPDPNKRKSYQLKRLNAHMRHPSFLAFMVIFWFCPLMTLDRFLLANVLSLYMYLAWNTDGEDYNYQRYQCDRKYYELQNLHD